MIRRIYLLLSAGLLQAVLLLGGCADNSGQTETVIVQETEVSERWHTMSHGAMWFCFMEAISRMTHSMRWERRFPVRSRSLKFPEK